MFCLEQFLKPLCMELLSLYCGLPTLPNLLINAPKGFYQNIQLLRLHSLHSNDLHLPTDSMQKWSKAFPQIPITATVSPGYFSYY